MILRGRAKEIVEGMVERGYANTQSEAIRLALVTFGEKRLGEVQLVNRKLDMIDAEIAGGRRRLLTAEEAMGKYGKGIK